MARAKLSKWYRDEVKKHAERLARPMRPYGVVVKDEWFNARNGKYETTVLRDYDREKAIDYARWLFARDGVAIDAQAKPVVRFERVKLFDGAWVKRCMSVKIGEDWVEFPGQYYDPARVDVLDEAA